MEFPFILFVVSEAIGCLLTYKSHAFTATQKGRKLLIVVLFSFLDCTYKATFIKRDTGMLPLGFSSSLKTL